MSRADECATDKRSVFTLIAVEAAFSIFNFSRSVFLAVIGISVGTAAVIALMQTSYNAQEEILQSFRSSGINIAGFQVLPSTDRHGSLSWSDAESTIKNTNGIESVAAINRVNAQVKAQSYNARIDVLAVTDKFFSITGAYLSKGRMTSRYDEHTAFAVVGANVANAFWEANGRILTIGEHLSFGKFEVVVIGVLKRTQENPLLNIAFDETIFLPFDAARKLRGQVSIDQLIVSMSDEIEIDQVVEALKTKLLKNMKSGEIFTISAKQLITSMASQKTIYGSLLTATGFISLFVGGVGIMNVMLMSVLERRQEIGIRRAIGARKNDILFMFLCEAILISTIGGALGSSIGFFVSWIFTFISGWIFTLYFLSLPISLAMSFIVGLFFGLYPALQAARVEPLVVLRASS
ncbi:ABC transporter permease [Pseudovibrio sp. Ad37]|uniref:ABC transporter permease n=1 Tax=Pseudovibrio sp. Ad37 TaxID=989422 RepID=UPI0007AE46AC|nr:ABC transporter permease [Pseudovibrio sp. Ad37]KZL19216.1 Macrolide export ATP-binding/permease protein MacB [Pseudovibrio sp. Ad37]